MPYTKQTWQDNNTAYPVSAQRMNNVEDGIDVAHDLAEAAGAAADAAQATANTKVGLSVVDAKGDLLVGTAPDAISRQALGANGQVLTVDTSTSTGVKWAPNGSPPLVTSLPTTGLVDGMEVRLKLSGGLGVWNCTYDASIADNFKWWVTGGTPLSVEDSTARSITISGGTQYQVYNLPGAAQITFPVGGFYDVGIYVVAYGASVAVTDLRMFLSVGSDNFSNGPMASLPLNGEATFTTAPRRVSGLSGTVARIKYMTSLASFSATTYDQRIVAAPVRVG